MAEYLNTSVTGSFTLPLITSESLANTSSAGSLYYNLEHNRVYYTYDTPSGITSAMIGSYTSGSNTLLS